jgi:acetylglutamate kinase
MMFQSIAIVFTFSLKLATTDAFVPTSNQIGHVSLRQNRIRQQTFLHSTTADDVLVEKNIFALDALKVAAAVSTLRGKTVVVKYGGNAMTSVELKDKFCEDVAALQQLGIRMVVVHGGGPQINSMLDKVGVESRFEGGLRVSSKEVVDVAEMVLCGSVNKEISSKICSKGGRAIGLSGRDDSLLQCVKEENKDGYDLQYVGNVVTVNTKLLNELLEMGICPVVSPIGTGMGDEKDIAYNVNADVAAGRIAGELRAERVLFLTDIAGVLNKEKQLFQSLSVSEINALIADETITGGMIPKVSYATSAVQLGVRGAFITDGRVPHALLTEVLGGGADGMGSGQGGTVVTL